MEKVRYMISDAASMAGVETHVLRYWEDELDLTIPRNEMGHRYYTRENIQEFQKIKELKEKGYQLKAIRTIIHNGGAIDPPPASAPAADAKTKSAAAANSSSQISTPKSTQRESAPARSPQASHKSQPTAPAVQKNAQPAAAVPQVQETDMPVINELSAEERMAQFRELMSDIVGRAISQNNEALSLDIGQEVRETVLKEMNYLFREQEDAQEERYKKLDAAIRGKVRSKHGLFSKKEKKEKKDKSRKVGDALPTN